MTGENRFVLSIYSKLLGQPLGQSQLDIIIRNCKDKVTIQDFRQLTNLGIPIISMRLFTKQKVIEHIFKEVTEFIPIAGTLNFRQYKKAVNKLKKAIAKSLKI